MVKPKKSGSIWEFRSHTGFEREAALVAYWEVALDPISDDYSPAEISARQLLDKWVNQVRGKYPDELVPIFWSVDSEEGGIYEFMPFQLKHVGVDEDFLTFFTWPVNPSTGERLNWLTLPVVDKLWNTRQANKGGFIQEATGWKPAILQSHVYLPTLLSALRA